MSLNTLVDYISNSQITSELIKRIVGSITFFVIPEINLKFN